METKHTQTCGMQQKQLVLIGKFIAMISYRKKTEISHISNLILCLKELENK